MGQNKVLCMSSAKPGSERDNTFFIFSGRSYAQDGSKKGGERDRRQGRGWRRRRGERGGGRGGSDKEVVEGAEGDDRSTLGTRGEGEGSIATDANDAAIRQ